LIKWDTLSYTLCNRRVISKFTKNEKLVGVMKINGSDIRKKIIIVKISQN